MAETQESTQKPEAAGKSRGRPKTRIGIVTSNKMQKTVVVTVTRRAPHPEYGKIMTLKAKYKAHAADHDYPKKVTLNEGDRVRIAETKPQSKDKRWRVVEVLKKAES